MGEKDIAGKNSGDFGHPSSLSALKELLSWFALADRTVINSHHCFVPPTSRSMGVHLNICILNWSSWFYLQILPANKCMGFFLNKCINIDSYGLCQR